MRGGEQRVVRGEGLIETLDDVRGVRISTRVDGTPIFVRDVASVSFAPMVRHGAATRDGRGEVVTGVVMMTKAQLDTFAPGLTRGLAIWTTDVMGTPLLKKDGYAPDEWPLVIPDDLYDELHTKDDPYWWMDAVVGLVLAHALMAHRDMERTPERDGVVYDFVGMPKRALFVLCRDYNNPATRERWAEVREMASRIFFRGAPLIRRREDIACDHLDASRLGPFNQHALEAWVVSRHVLENAHKVDEALARRETRRAGLRAWLDEQGKQATPVQEDDLPTHPDRTRAPSSRGAARVTPDIFLGTLLDMPVQLAVQVHFRFNRSNGRTLTLEQIEVSCGRAMWRKRRRPRPSRRKGRVEKVIKAGIRRGLWSQRRDPGTGQAQPILVRATLRPQHASYRVLVDPGRPQGAVARAG